MRAEFFVIVDNLKASDRQMIVCLSVEKPLGYTIQFGAGFVRHVYSNLFAWVKFQL